MTIVTNTTSDTPNLSLMEFKEAVREKIRSGAYKAGHFLPSLRLLAAELNTPLSVVRIGVNDLTEEGYLAKKWNCRPIIVPQHVQEAATGSEEDVRNSRTAPSRLVAMIMWNGGSLGQGSTAQERIFLGINRELGAAGYHTVFLNIGASLSSEEDNALREAAHLQYVIDNNFDGVIFYPISYERNHDLAREVARKMPLILIDRMLPGVETDYVGMQNRQAMVDSMAYLARLGHHRIAYVTNNEPILTVQHRLQGYLQGIVEHLEPHAFEMVLPMPSKHANRWPVFDIVFRSKPADRPTAVLCLNDYDALAVAMRLDTLGLRIPEDVSIIGCDNIIQTLPNGRGLTTIAQPYEIIGAEAAKLFIRRTTDHSPEPIYVEVPATLVTRDSCMLI